MANIESIVRRVLDNYRGTIRAWGMALEVSGITLLCIGVVTMISSCDPSSTTDSGFWWFSVSIFWLGFLISNIGSACLEAKDKGSIISCRHRIRLLSMAKRLENEASISGTDYGNFLIIFNREEALDHLEKEQITWALKELVIEKGRRISGHDYIELEKTLARAGNKKVGLESIMGEKKNVKIEIFSEIRKQEILEDYEKLREGIRDRSLIGS